MNDTQLTIHSETFYINTRVLSPKERACYLDLLIFYSTKGVIPLDTSKMVRYCSGTEKECVEYVLGKFFVKVKNGWTTKKIYVSTSRTDKVENIKTQGYVYLMKDTTNGFIKIGHSVNPSRREKTLQSEKPTIDLTFIKQGSTSNEAELHRIFKDKRIRGEWFDLNQEDVRFIESYTFNN